MVLEKNVIADYRKAGEITAEALAYGKKLVKPGANILEVCLAIEKKIRGLGGEPAFPVQPSINQVAAHWCPDPGSDEVFQEGQLVKLDMGAHVNGRVGDTALSIDLSEDGRWKELISAAEEARDAALKLMTPGTTLGEIGKTIQEVINSKGFSPIINLSGHGLGDYEVHTWPSIPNIPTGDNTELQEDMIVAVEPFATPGQGKIYEQEKGNIYSLTQERPVRTRYARQALKEITNYNGLPFCLHWLSAKLGVGPARFAIRELEQVEAIEDHPPLVEVSGGVVSQAENSVIVRDKPIIYTRV